ncbi:MAG TPA: hypothetical protein VNM39_08425, partial [Verrucomicrobiae bacterium]|nr:hypothetical protein [Verrucomicrobiae bacterium]
MRRSFLAFMRSTAGLLALAATLSLSGRAAGEEAKPKSTTTPTTTTPPAATQQTMTMKEAKQKLGIVVFPAKGQTAQQQEKEEYECLMWGADQAGVTSTSMKDPKAAGQAAAAHVDSAAAGAAVKG